MNNVNKVFVYFFKMEVLIGKVYLIVLIKIKMRMILILSLKMMNYVLIPTVRVGRVVNMSINLIPRCASLICLQVYLSPAKMSGRSTKIRRPL